MINADNLLFFSPISIRLPSELYDLIEADARLFGFIKNGKGNINGFLNQLLPSIIDMFSNVSTAELFGDVEEPTPLVFKNPMVYLDTLFKPLLKGNNVTISFRVNKAHEQDFRNIYKNILPFFNKDFSALFRSLLTCYVTNRLAIRERFVYFKNYSEISNATAEKKECVCFLKKEIIRFSCLKIFVSPITDRNILLGIEKATGKINIMPFALIDNAIMQEEDSENVKVSLKVLTQGFRAYLQGEKKLQNR